MSSTTCSAYSHWPLLPSATTKVPYVTAFGFIPPPSISAKMREEPCQSPSWPRWYTLRGTPADFAHWKAHRHSRRASFLLLPSSASNLLNAREVIPARWESSTVPRPAKAAEKGRKLKGGYVETLLLSLSHVHHIRVLQPNPSFSDHVPAYRFQLELKSMACVMRSTTPPCLPSCFSREYAVALLGGACECGVWFICRLGRTLLPLAVVEPLQVCMPAVHTTSSCGSV
eukprot:1188143-Prorocentrum_minimum.AAC.2